MVITMKELRIETLDKIDETIKLANNALEQLKTAASRCESIISELKELRYRVEFVIDDQLEEICSLIDLDHVNTILNRFLPSEE